MNWLRSMTLAFALFSRIPMPRIEWNQQNRHYVLCFFPLIGTVIGLVLWGWLWFSSWLGLGTFLFAAGLTLIPLLVNGGIHLDGFCDTLDALASHAGPERRHEIMKDPHVGVFAVIGLVMYLLAYAALCTELERTGSTILLLGLIHVLTRIFCGLVVLLIPACSQTGLCAALQQDTARKRVIVCLILLLLLCGGGLIWINHLAGISLLLAGLAGGGFVYRLVRRHFGGMNGDLAGYYLQLAELFMLVVLVLLTKGGLT